MAGSRENPMILWRSPGTVYHFLLPDDGMANYRDKAAKILEAADFERIKVWRKAFFQPFQEEEIAELETLSNQVDALWALHTEQLARDRPANRGRPAPCGASPAPGRRAAPPTSGRTASAPKACSARAPARLAPTAA